MSENSKILRFTRGVSLGQWIKQQRESQKINIGALADRSKIDQGTISRIENNRTQPTIFSIVRLGENLGFTWKDVLAESLPSGVPDRVAPDYVSRDSAVLSRDDLAAFTACYETPLQQRLKDFLGRTLNTVLDREARYRGQSVETALDANTIITLMQLPEVCRVIIGYPPIAYQPLIAYYQRGGVIIAQDGQAIVKALYEYQKAWPDHVPPAFSSLIRRLKEPSLERVKFSAVLYTDMFIRQHTNLELPVLPFYWDACRYSMADQATSPLSQLILLYRWLQYHQDGETSDWLRELRALAESAPETA